MKRLLILALMAALVGLFTQLGSARLTRDTSQNLLSAFTSYADRFSKQYPTLAIFKYRLGIYERNMRLIAQLNEEDQATGVYGETFFSDLTVEEVKEGFMGLKVPENPQESIHYTVNYTDLYLGSRKDPEPQIWNWIQQGAVSSVKDQGSCGSCWAFSTAGTIQSTLYLRDPSQPLVEMSMQHLVDCDKSNFGCGGGWPYVALTWLSTHGGIASLKTYPLRANYSGPCQFDRSQAAVQIKGYMNVTHDETIIKDALYQVGPLSILLDFTGLMHYKSGVASPKYCSTWPDHALVLVGYGIEDEEYWLIKNSWGPKWGVNGYFRLKRGAQKCGVNLWATRAVFE